MPTYYPPGLELVPCFLRLGGPGGDIQSGEARVETERKVAHSGWVMTRFSKPHEHRFSGGLLELELPYSDASGLLADNGAPLAPALLGYRLDIVPLNDTSFGWENQGWFTLPKSLGAGPIDLSTRLHLGGWPNQTVTIVAPGGGGGSWVPATVAGSTTGAWRWQPA